MNIYYRQILEDSDDSICDEKRTFQWIIWSEILYKYGKC
jgi:hypothetical protein